MAELLIIALLFAALVGLVFCWAEWQKQLRHIGVSSWPKAGLTLGLFAATSQALLFVYTWTPLSRFHQSIVARDESRPPVVCSRDSLHFRMERFCSLVAFDL